MTNEEIERIMNFIIERQETFADQMSQSKETFADQMSQSNERMTRLETATAHQQQMSAHQQAAIFAMIDSQEKTSMDVRNLTTVVDRLVETVAVILERTSGENGNGSK